MRHLKPAADLVQTKKSNETAAMPTYSKVTKMGGYYNKMSKILRVQKKNIGRYFSETDKQLRNCLCSLGKIELLQQ
jgi:hypothetical protein